MWFETIKKKERNYIRNPLHKYYWRINVRSHINQGSPNTVTVRRNTRGVLFDLEYFEKGTSRGGISYTESLGQYQN